MNINGTTDKDIQWIVMEAMAQGVYKEYRRIERSLPSCKKYMYSSKDIYDDCRLEKANYSLEQAKGMIQ